MKKYYVIYMPIKSRYLIACATSIEDNTLVIENAGKWDSEESAANWVDNNAFDKVYFNILPLYIRNQFKKSI